MQVAIIGAGALGCLFGGRIAAAGCDVTLLHYRQDYVDKLNRSGLRIKSNIGGAEIEISVPATTDAASVGPVDLVLVFVKAHQTEIALDQHATCIGPKTLVLSLQNGVDHYETLLNRVGPDRALGGVTHQGAVVAKPGVIDHTGDGVSKFGGIDETAVAEVANILAASEIPVQVVNNPNVTIWEKQLISVPIKPLAALTRLPNGEIISDEGLLDLIERLVAETKAVAAARGVDLPNKDYVKTIQDICESSATHRSSMLQDVLAERKTEIGAVNEAIVDIAREEGVDVPMNEAVTILVRGLERSYS